MFNIGFWELIVILLVALLVVGPKDLPKVARSLARGIKRLRAMVDEVKRESGLGEVEQELKQVTREVKVKVTMDGDKIAKIEVLSHSETAGISDPAFTQIPEAIIAANSTEVDVVTGATRTSDALIAAVNDALSQVK
ncbi:MAG TPA: twin-arginine translocase subunit TatB [Candidatus Avichristensenella intestinipullorum]|jgi:Tat protein translocase TatB subunit|uniref:Twin-arginine translocase subunit TatB n=1 Tax=Candidatus Avichristensenella intestinipullorum TaxID=2840693 RepID=A0A9D0YU85_9FIRM|nr:twin-arginine translocase subunit TatB [Candidatus Avichristensenella intestinipullorum]